MAHQLLSVINQHFGVTFPEPVQESLVRWIERRLHQPGPLPQQLPEPVLEQEANTFLNILLDKLHKASLVIPPGATHVQLSTAMATLRQLNPLQLYTTLLEHLQSSESQPPTIDQQVNVLQQMVRKCKAQVGSITQMTAFERGPQIVELARDLWVIVERATVLANHIICTSLMQWRIGQERHDLDQAGSVTLLDTIQQSCEALACVVWSIHDLIVAIPRLEVLPKDLPVLFGRTKELLVMLATKCFLVECQPPRVIKTNTKYSVGVRHLLGSQLHSRMVGMKLQACIISEAQASNTQRSNQATQETSGVLTFEDGVLELDKDSNRLKATFRNLQVKKIQRQERRGAECVTDEKFTFRFDLSFTVGDMKFSVSTISQPVVVIVHANQETAANATIVWDNAFADPCRTPFEVSERTAWNLLTKMLNRKVRSMFLDRPLSAENFHFLGVKATRRNLPFPVPDTELVTRAQFCRDLIPMRTFTFWEWFYAAIKVTRDFLKDIWNAGHIIGFIDKARAEEDLRRHPPGTFLLRFSDSQLGGITIAYVTKEPSRRIQHINPFIGKDAANAINAIRDLPQLKLLYPGVPKGEAFGRHFQPLVPPIAGYVPAVPEVSPANDSNQAFSFPMVTLDDLQLVDLNLTDLMEF